MTIAYPIEGPWRGQLAILARPRGGDWLDDDIRAWCEAGVNVVVSFLTPDETCELDLAREERACKTAGIEFLGFPIADRSIPASRNAAIEFLRSLEKYLAAGRYVGVHCRQGIGRSSLVAASLFVLAGLASKDAFARVSTARKCAVPETREQQAWVEELAHSLIHH